MATPIVTHNKTWRIVARREIVYDLMCDGEVIHTTKSEDNVRDALCQRLSGTGIVSFRTALAKAQALKITKAYKGANL